MNAKVWVAGLVAVVLVESAIGMALWVMGLIENCGSVTSPQVLECSETLHDLLVAALFAVPALYVVLFALAAKRDEARRLGQ